MRVSASGLLSGKRHALTEIAVNGFGHRTHLNAENMLIHCPPYHARPCAYAPSPHIVVYATIHDKETHIQQLHIQQSACCLDNESHICPIHKLAPFSESQKREPAVCVVLLAQLGVLVEHEGGDFLAAFAHEHWH